MSFNQILLIGMAVVIALYMDWQLIKWMRRKRKEFGKSKLAQWIFSHSGRIDLNWLRSRWVLAFLGVTLIVIGQWQINKQTIPESQPTKAGIWLNENLFLGDPGVDNILNALPLFLFGGILLSMGLQGVPLLPKPREFFNNVAIDARRIFPHWRWLLIASGLFIFLIAGIRSENFLVFQVPVWILSLIIFTVAIAARDVDRHVDLSPHLERIDWLWMIGLMIAAIFVGVYRLQGLPDQLMGDEGNFWTIARDIAQGNFKPSIFASGVYSFPVFSSILQSWFMRLFGIDLWGWRFSSVIMGIAALPPLYLLAREGYGRKVAVVSAIALASSPYFIDFSRLGYNNIQAVFFMTLTLYWLYIGIHRKSSFYLFLAGAAAGLGFYTYFAARFSIVISLAFIGLLWFGKKITFKEFLLSTAVLGIGFGLVAAPYITHGSIADPQAMSYKMWESAFFNSFNGLQFYSKEELFSVAPSFTINDNELFFNPKIYLTLILRGFLRTMIVFQRQGLISEHYIAFPLAGTSGVIFYLLGFALTLKTFKQPRSLLIILWFFANVFGLSALNTVPPRHTHMITIIPALALLTGIGLNAAASAIAAMLFPRKKMGIMSLLLFTIVIAASGIYDFFGRVPALYHAQPDQVISWAILDSKGESFVELYTDPLQKDIRPYAVEEFRKNIPYESVSASQVLSEEKKFSDQPTIVFYPPQIMAQVDAVLRKQWGDSFIGRIFYSTGGGAVLAAGMNTPFVFEQDKPFITILSESYTRFSLWALLAGLLACLTIAAFLPSKWLFKFPTLSRLTNWVNTPVPEPFNFPADDYDILKESVPAPTVTKVKEITISDPPEWAVEQGFIQLNQESASTPSKRGYFFKTQIKPVRDDNGTDYYIKIHLPKIKLPKLSLSGLPGLNNLKESINLPALQFPDGIILIGVVILAVFAQVMINNQSFRVGILAYLMSTVGLLIWAHNNPKWKSIFTSQLQLNQRGEAILLSLIILLTILTRFFDLNSRVYGIEADESKWTVQTWYSTILRVDIGEFGGRHFKFLPVDFWMRSIFLRIFGLDFVSARIESAVLSLIAVVCLYFLVRFLTSSKAAGLLSSLLFSLSFIELNASHQALHNTPPEAWMIASLAVLFLALRDRKLWQFQFAGILLCMGMLTYETFYPNIVAAFLYLIGYAIFEIRNKRASIISWITNLALVVWPVIVIYFGSTREYMAQRQGHHMGWLAASFNTQDLLNLITLFWGNFITVLEVTFSRVVWVDSLINWSGPLVNPLLLPFIVIGLIYNLWNIRRAHFAFIPLWYAIHILTGPILLGSPWPRVMYLAIPPLMIWGALGLWVTLASLRAFFENQKISAAVPVFGLLIAFILIKDYVIFRTELTDPEERQKRRELADLTLDSAKETPLLLFPYMPNQEDSVFVESHVLLYAVGGAKNLGLDAAEHYKQLEMNSLLSALWRDKDIGGLDVIYDKTAPNLTEEREQVIQVMLTCYPQAELSRQAVYFDIYHFSPQALQSPACYSPPAPVTTTPKDQVSTTPINFSWNSNGTVSTSFALTLDRKRANIIWIEAEDAFSGSGWYPNGGYINGFSGTGFVLDNWDSGETTYSINVPKSGQYRLWVRYYKRRNNDQHNFISINGQTNEFAETGSPIEEWTWKSIGTYELGSGELPLSLSRTYGADEQYSVFIDSVVVTSDLSFTPDLEDSLWEQAYYSGEIGTKESQFRMDESMTPGEYRWKVRIFDGDSLIDSSGSRGIESDKAQFTLQ